MVLVVRLPWMALVSGDDVVAFFGLVAWALSSFVFVAIILTSNLIPRICTQNRLSTQRPKIERESKTYLASFTDQRNSMAMVGTEDCRQGKKMMKNDRNEEMKYGIEDGLV